MAEKWQTVQYTLAIQRFGIVQVATLHAAPYTSVAAARWDGRGKPGTAAPS